MQLIKNGITIEVADAQVFDLILERLRRDQSIIRPSELPQIDMYWDGQGGIFAGIMRGRDGGKDYALIKGPNIESGEWQETLDRAAAIEVYGHKDFRLPYRAELSLLYANLPDRFEKKWYWSCEQHPADENSAFAQSFFNGYQNVINEDDTCLGCAVRTIPLW